MASTAEIAPHTDQSSDGDSTGYADAGTNREGGAIARYAPEWLSGLLEEAEVVARLHHDMADSVMK